MSMKPKSEKLLNEVAKYGKINENGQVVIQSVDAFVEMLDTVTAKRTAALSAALTFYGTGLHFQLHDHNEWDSVSGEPGNLLEHIRGGVTVEDGTIAEKALENAANEIFCEGETVRNMFEDAAYNAYFISTIRKVDDGPFGLQPVGAMKMVDFLRRDGKGLYIDEGIEAAWWGWRNATTHRGNQLVLPRVPTPEMMERVFEGPLGNENSMTPQDQQWITELYNAFAGKDGVGQDEYKPHKT